MKLSASKLVILRRTVQIGVLALLFTIPAVARYQNYLVSHELDRTIERWDGTLPGGWLAGMDAVFRAMPGGEMERAGALQRNRDQVLEYSRLVRGSAWSAQLGPISMTDPLAGAESIAASKSIAPVLLVGLAIPILITVVFGRVFCSWVCPMGFIFEMTDKLRRVAVFLEIKPRNVRYSPSTKYALLAVGLILAAVFSVPLLGYIYPPAIAGREIHDLVFALFDRAEIGRFGWTAEGLSWMTLLLGAVVAFEVLISRRWWCRYVCPGGALYSMLGSSRPVRVQLDSRSCTSCADCVRVCPMGLNPMHAKMGAECDSCGLCISVCEDDALAYGLGWNDELPTNGLSDEVKA